MHISSPNLQILYPTSLYDKEQAYMITYKTVHGQVIAIGRSRGGGHQGQGLGQGPIVESSVPNRSWVQCQVSNISHRGFCSGVAKMQSSWQ